MTEQPELPGLNPYYQTMSDETPDFDEPAEPESTDPSADIGGPDLDEDEVDVSDIPDVPDYDEEGAE